MTKSMVTTDQLNCGIRNQ